MPEVAWTSSGELVGKKDIGPPLNISTLNPGQQLPAADTLALRQASCCYYYCYDYYYDNYYYCFYC